MLAAAQPYPQYFDLDGSPLDGGRIYYGGANLAPQTNPITVYWDAAGTQPAAQPIQTLNGVPVRAGSPAAVYVSGDYSVQVLNRRGMQVAYCRSALTVDNSIALQAGIDGVRTDLASTADSGKGAALVGYLPAWGPGRGVRDKLLERKSLLDGASDTLKAAVASGVYTDALRTEMLTTAQAAWAAALASGYDLHAPGGLYQIGDANWPWRQPPNIDGSPLASLLDCRGITIYGDGPATVFSTYSDNGADVFQLNGLKNFHLRNLRITATLTDFGGAGSNAISVTGGWDNITIDGVICENLPYTDKGYTDGGKALSVQPGAAGAGNAWGTLRARYIAIGCSEGFGADLDLFVMMTKRPNIDLDYSAVDCYRAFKVSAAGASGALPTGLTCGITAWVKATDCQQDVALARAHGVRVDCQVITSKSAAQRRLSPRGAAWVAADTVVEAVSLQYAKNSGVHVHGNKGACDYKARLGAVSPGSSGLNGATEYCDIDLDVGGTAAVADIAALTFGGNYMRSSTLRGSGVTATSLPAEFGTPSYKNRLLLDNVYTGTFTATLAGVSDATAPTGTIKWSMSGDQVTLEIPAITGTSNSTSANLSGMPDNLKPASAQYMAGFVTNSGAVVAGLILLTTAGVLTLTVGTSSGGFTAAGTKGSAPMTITYRRS